jgi:PAS domain S-box-containing protein
LIGTPIGGFLDESDARKMHHGLAALTPKNPSMSFENPVSRHDGARRWFHWTNIGTFDSHGNLIEGLGVGWDITERKQVEIALKESEERFRALVSNSPQAGFLKDRDGKYLIVNEVFEKWYGKGGEIIGKTVYDIFPFDKADAFARQDMEVMKAGASRERKIELALSDGTEQITLFTKFTVFGPDGNIIAIGGIDSDITERERAAAALKESEKRLRLFTDAMPALFSYVDKDRRYRFCNLSYEKHFRRKREDIIGRTVEEITGPETYEQIKPLIDRVFSGENVFYEQWVDYREAGRTFVRGSLIPDISPSGTVEGMFVMVQDMTGKKQAEDILAKAKERAEKTSASKSRFLAAASHDLRQPMQALAMFVDVLAGREHDEGSRDIIEKIQSSSKSLQSLLNSLLDISKLEADLVVPAVRRFTIGELTSRLAEEIGPLAEKKGLRLIHVPTQLQVRSDPGLLDRILRNLLTNALKNTDEGQILFGCRRRGGTLSIEVWDTGRGIPEGQKDRIFEEFYQGGDEDRKPRGGLGLGLAIVDRLVALLEHRIEVGTGASGGAVFRVSVPIAEAFEAAPPVQRRSIDRAGTPSGALVVGIDDDPSVREALSLLLESWGFTAVTAATANEAMQRLSEANRTPDLVIADYQLQQGKKGSHAIRDIQRRWGEDIPGLLLTGDVEPRRLKEAAASGFQVVHKPIQPDRLKAVVAEQIKSKKSGGDADPRTRKQG